MQSAQPRVECFEEIGDYLKASLQLTAQGNHLHAVACFGMLYELIDAGIKTSLG